MFTVDKISLQMYSIRDALAVDFEGTIRRVAEMGYRAVEGASLPAGVTPQQARTLFDSLGIRVPSTHARLHTPENHAEVIDFISTLGCEYVLCPYIAPEDFATLDGIKKSCDMLNESNAIAKSHGWQFGYHNHWWEAHLHDGRPVYEVMMDYLEPDILFEVDTYWMKVGGLDPVAVVQKLGDRAPLLHIKDGVATVEASMTAVGDGVMPVPALLQANQAQWYVVELDRCDTDMLTAVAKSYTYLKGLA